MENADEMQLEHLRSTEWDCVTCCQDNQDNGMCSCDQITDDESFAQCQEGMRDL